jgi:hypothetical protein
MIETANTKIRIGTMYVRIDLGGGAEAFAAEAALAA